MRFSLKNKRYTSFYTPTYLASLKILNHNRTKWTDYKNKINKHFLKNWRLFSKNKRWKLPIIFNKKKKLFKRYYKAKCRSLKRKYRKNKKFPHFRIVTRKKTQQFFISRNNLKNYWKNIKLAKIQNFKIPFYKNRKLKRYIILRQSVHVWYKNLFKIQFLQKKIEFLFKLRLINFIYKLFFDLANFFFSYFKILKKNKNILNFLFLNSKKKELLYQFLIESYYVYSILWISRFWILNFKIVTQKAQDKIYHYSNFHYDIYESDLVNKKLWLKTKGFYNFYNSKPLYNKLMQRFEEGHKKINGLKKKNLSKINLILKKKSNYNFFFKRYFIFKKFKKSFIYNYRFKKFKFFKHTFMQQSKKILKKKVKKKILNEKDIVTWNSKINLEIESKKNLCLKIYKRKAKYDWVISKVEEALGMVRERHHVICNTSVPNFDKKIAFFEFLLLNIHFYWTMIRKTCFLIAKLNLNLKKNPTQYKNLNKKLKKKYFIKKNKVSKKTYKYYLYKKKTYLKFFKRQVKFVFQKKKFQRKFKNQWQFKKSRYQVKPFLKQLLNKKSYLNKKRFLFKKAKKVIPNFSPWTIKNKYFRKRKYLIYLRRKKQIKKLKRWIIRRNNRKYSVIKLKLRSNIKMPNLKKKKYKLYLQKKALLSSFLDNQFKIQENKKILPFKCNSRLEFLRHCLVKPLYRIDILMYHLQLAINASDAQNKIVYKHVTVNNNYIKANYFLRLGDIVSLDLLNFPFIKNIKLLRYPLKTTSYFPFISFDRYSCTITIVKSLSDISFKDIAIIYNRVWERIVSLRHYIF